MENKLALFSVYELLKEVENRCECFTASYIIYNEDDAPVRTLYGKGKWFEAISCAAILHNDVINNWNNELEVLQKISEEMKEE
jgi:hypothetical protein